MSLSIIGLQKQREANRPVKAYALVRLVLWQLARAFQNEPPGPIPSSSNQPHNYSQLTTGSRMTLCRHSQIKVRKVGWKSGNKKKSFVWKILKILILHNNIKTRNYLHVVKKKYIFGHRIIRILFFSSSFLTIWKFYFSKLFLRLKLSNVGLIIRKFVESDV